MLRSEKISSRLFRRSRGERSDKKREGRGKKGLLREIFRQQKEKTEKISFLYCEFYSEQKILRKSSIVRKSIRKKQKVLREIFSAAKIAQKETNCNNLYIIYKTANKIMHIRGNRQGRGEGRQEEHSFSKMQTAKRRRRAAGNYFYKNAEKKLSIDARGGTIESFFSAKNKENSEKCSRPQGPSVSPYYREQVTASVVV